MLDARFEVVPDVIQAGQFESMGVLTPSRSPRHPCQDLGEGWGNVYSPDFSKSGIYYLFFLSLSTKSQSKQGTAENVQIKLSIL